MTAATAAAQINWRAVWRTVILLAALGALLFFMTRIPRTIEVFIVATLIAYGVNPIVRWLCIRCPRPIAVAFVYAGLLVIILVAGIVIVPETVNQLEMFFGNSAAYLDSVQHFLNSAQQWLGARFGHYALPPQLQNIEGYALTKLGAMFNEALSGVGNFVINVANVIVISITAIILSYYLLTHSDEVRTTFYRLFPEKSQPLAQQFAREVARVFGGYIYGQVLLSTFCGIITFAALALAGFNYALLLGVLTGLLYAIPYLGVFAAVILGFLLGLLQSWKMAVFTVVAIFAITKIADTLLVPKVMGQSVGVSPMAIIFAVFAGGELFGLWGLVLGIPAAAIFKVIWNVWLHPWLTEHPLFLTADKSEAASD